MKSQARVRWTMLTGAVVLAGAAACAAKVDEAPRESGRVAQTLPARPAHHFRGPVRMVIDAARTHANLSTEQAEALDVVAAELDADATSHRELHARLKSSAVAVVRGGSASSPELQRAVDEAVGVVEERMKRGGDALEEIHGLLEPAQRSAVATALRAHVAERFGKAPRDAKRPREGFRRLAEFLMLSPQQLDELEAAKKELLGERRELRPSREELLALVDAFEGEDFRAALEAFRANKTELLRLRVRRAGQRADSVLAIFTPEQRELLADLILEGPRKVLFGEEDAAAVPR